MNSGKKVKFVSEQDYIRDTLITRRSEAEWQTQFSGKDHLVIPASDFSVTLCGRIVISDDYWEIDGITPPVTPNKCKQCMEAEAIK